MQDAAGQHEYMPDGVVIWQSTPQIKEYSNRIQQAPRHYENQRDPGDRSGERLDSS